MRIRLESLIPMAIGGSIRPPGTVILEGELAAGVSLERFERILEGAGPRGKIAWRPAPELPEPERPEPEPALKMAEVPPPRPDRPARRPGLMRGRGGAR